MSGTIPVTSVSEAVGNLVADFFYFAKYMFVWIVVFFCDLTNQIPLKLIL